MILKVLRSSSKTLQRLSNMCLQHNTWNRVPYRLFNFYLQYLRLVIYLSNLLIKHFYLLSFDFLEWIWSDFDSLVSHMNYLNLIFRRWHGKHGIFVGLSVLSRNVQVLVNLYCLEMLFLSLNIRTKLLKVSTLKLLLKFF